uniref:Uncharacterized protein n=1 Tax=Picea glauca TaxID=3330 RepID=A0A117NFJ0_PICGL|nr:hypothetical protein ABT39_MTgene3391 [Picea glauca]KUM45464.1 hypothetical protein ABT39_MTgene2566 [Picea glauca]KUM45469.1 hypothetical protein ABT39_MTgene2571 [Picea glauca]
MALLDLHLLGFDLTSLSLLASHCTCFHLPFILSLNPEPLYFYLPNPYIRKYY